jgi:uncharacterized protein YrrD
MLQESKDLVGMTVKASDGDLGHVRECYFDDEAWVIRYLVVQTGAWLLDRRVLVSPMSMGKPNCSLKTLHARLTREQVRNSPDIDSDKSVSRQHELEFHRYYGYPYYWGYRGVWATERLAYEPAQCPEYYPQLRSCKSVTGYHIQAVDGDIGHVQGMLFDEESSAIRYLIVNTGNWWRGHQVLIAPESIADVSWPDRRVVVQLTRQAIREAVPYDRALLPDRQGETLVYERYGHDGCWQYDSLSSVSPRAGPADAHLVERG